MMKTKICYSDSTALLERDINTFLDGIGSNPHIQVTLMDIKYSALSPFNKEKYTAMIIYNEVVVKDSI